ncbi:MAG: DUF2313 domain-containing protein [Planctomycetaceae bacterium]|nr:DUF2313 domain-containing protein [Planctomycetaceae bacterium]
MMHQYDEEAYTQQLRELMPQGKAWDFSHNGVLMRLLRGLAGAVHRFGVQVSYVYAREVFSHSTDDLLDEWETELGLPDECRSAVETREQRRFEVVAKYNQVGGQSIPYFIELGRSLGLELEIDRCQPFRVGRNGCGDPVQDAEWNFFWRVKWIPTQETPFRVGQDTMGTPLRSWTRNTTLECLFQKLGPAPGNVIFAYRDISEGA